MRKSGLLNPLLLLLCWTGLVGAGTFVLIETTVRQHLAEGFPTTKGRIIRSEMGQGNIIRRGIEIEYTYAVNGIKYHGHRYRYDDHNMTLEWQSTIVENPRWSFQKVYYNPQDPADSLLMPGIDGGDLLLLLFALPLIVLTATLWRAMISQIREHYGIRPPAGVRIRKRSGQTRVPLGETMAFGTGFYAMAIMAVVISFPVVVAGGFDPSVPLVKTTWAVVGAAGIAGFLWRLIRNVSGVYELRIDEKSRDVVLPQTAGRRQSLSLPVHEITGVLIQRRVSTNPSGMRFSYLPSLILRTAQEDQVTSLITWGWSEEKARAFSQWLCHELGVEFKGIVDEKAPMAKGGATLVSLNPPAAG